MASTAFVADVFLGGCEHGFQVNAVNGQARLGGIAEPQRCGGGLSGDLRLAGQEFAPVAGDAPDLSTGVAIILGAGIPLVFFRFFVPPFHGLGILAAVFIDSRQLFGLAQELLWVFGIQPLVDFDVVEFFRKLEAPDAACQSGDGLIVGQRFHGQDGGEGIIAAICIEEVSQERLHTELRPQEVSEFQAGSQARVRRLGLFCQVQQPAPALAVVVGCGV